MTCDKGLFYKIYKEFFKANTEKTKNLTEKWAKDLSRHLSKEDKQMANKYTKMCSASYVCRKWQMKTTVRPLYTQWNGQNVNP